MRWSPTLGKTATGYWMDDAWGETARLTGPDGMWLPESASEKQHMTDTFKACGITPPKHATQSIRGWGRFLAYALKRARSNHPHNAKWKPLLGAYTAMQVAAKFEESL